MRNPLLSPLRLLILACIAALLVVLPVQVSHAAEYSAGCEFGFGNTAELINAINAANSTPDNDIIHLGAGCSYRLTSINNTTGGSNGLPVILNAATSGSLTINGNGSAIVAQISFFALRIFYTATGANLTLNNLYIGNGNIDVGGGIYNNGLLILNSSIVASNKVWVTGGSAYGGGIYNVGTLGLFSSTIANNVAGDGTDAGYGGGIYNTGSL